MGKRIVAEQSGHYILLQEAKMVEAVKEAVKYYVDQDELSFWLNPVSLARNLGFSASELRRIERIIQEHQP